jgi:hypothetical protein
LNAFLLIALVLVDPLSLSLNTWVYRREELVVIVIEAQLQNKFGIALFDESQPYSFLILSSCFFRLTGRVNIWYMFFLQALVRIFASG